MGKIFRHRNSPRLAQLLGSSYSIAALIVMSLGWLVIEPLCNKGWRNLINISTVILIIFCVLMAIRDTNHKLRHLTIRFDKLLEDTVFEPNQDVEFDLELEPDASHTDIPTSSSEMEIKIKQLDELSQAASLLNIPKENLSTDEYSMRDALFGKIKEDQVNN